MMEETVGDPQSQTGPFKLPAEAKLFSNQVSGHRHGQGRLGIGVLKHQNGDLLKPLLKDDRRATAELSFYKKIYETQDTDPWLQKLSHFLPAFNGIWDTHIAGKEVTYLCLEDVTKKFDNPSVMDIKMGCKTYDHDANEAKILSQTTKFPFGDALGIRILGMKIYSDDEKAYLPQNEKLFWRHLNPDTITSGLQMYLTSNKCINSLILSGFIHKLSQLNDWFSKQRQFRFIASSLLFVYEGSFSHWSMWLGSNGISMVCNLSTGSVEDSSCPINDLHTSNIHADSKDICIVCGLCKNICSKLDNCKLLRLAMIDFAHCCSSKSEDTNYTFGLNKLIIYLKDLLKIQI